MGIPRVLSDPLAAFNFRIALIDTSSVLSTITTGVSAAVSGGFTEVTGLDASLITEDYLEGGVNTYTHKFPTRIVYGNITLKRGITLSEDLWNWHYSFVQGKGKRRDGMVFLQNELKIPVKTWIFKRALPLKWVGPTFNASASAIAIESLELAHEGVDLLSPGAVATAAADAVGDAIGGALGISL
jgi:phage tail-like protein